MSGVQRVPVFDSEAQGSRSVCARLSDLAPLHQRAALKKAKALAGLEQEYEIPPLTILTIAENPPEKQWRVEFFSLPEKPTAADIKAKAALLLYDTKFLAGIDSVLPQSVIEARAELAAEMICWREYRGKFPFVRKSETCINAVEHAHGQQLAEDHRPLLEAVAEVLDSIETLIPHSRLAAMPDSDIKELAQTKADDARARYTRRANDTLKLWGEIIPDPSPDERREMCQIAQRRKLRRLARSTRSHLATALGTVGKGGRWYADDYTLERHRELREAGRTWASERELRSPDGKKSISMLDVVTSSKENAVRRLRTMTRGLDDYAVKHGLPAIFITMTLPPELHFNPQHGRAYPELDPKAVDQKARLLWQRFRARLSANDIPCRGFRVWEPHKDSTPHIHALLYLDTSEQVSKADEILLDLCREPDIAPRDEMGNPRRVASRLEIIDRRKGSGASYLSKYLTEVIAEEVDAGDEEASAKRANAEKVRATASERGWRRYAFLGVHGVQSIWQRIISMNKIECASAPARVLSIKKYIEEHRYCEALEELGAIKRADENGQKHAPILKLDYEEKVTQYGDMARRAVAMSTRDNAWTLRLSRGWTCEKTKRTEIKDEKTSAITVAVSYPRQEAMPPAKEESTETFGDLATIPPLRVAPRRPPPRLWREEDEFLEAA